MEMLVPWAIFAAAAAVRAGSCSKGSCHPSCHASTGVGIDPMLHVLTVKAGSCVGCTAECVSAESFSLEVFNKTPEFFSPGHSESVRLSHAAFCSTWAHQAVHI